MAKTISLEEKKPLEEFDEPEEPSVTSADPNERKLARRLRIQRRIEALKRQEGVEEEEIIEKTPTEKQIDASDDLLEKLITEGEEVIANVRVANDARESQRRHEEKALRKKLLLRLEEEAKDSMEKYKKINSKWSVILESNDPLDIHCDMEAQNVKCLEILAEKNKVIAELKEELENADSKFTKDQRKQSDDINLLIERIDNQIITMAKAYRRELALIGQAIESERKVVLVDNAKKWETLYKQRNQNELDGIEQRKEIMREYEMEMKRVMIEHQEEYRSQKILLEMEHQTLQQEVQHMKAMCMMNIEKLDYSYAVLKRREDENTIIKSQQKRRINKLQDIVNGLKKTYMDLEESTRLEIQRLTEQVIKTHKNILELEAKSNHFTVINEKQYLQIWDMNAKCAEELVHKILTADRIIYEQTLGLEWEPPEEPLLTKEDLPSYCGAVDAIDKRKVDVKERQKVCGPREVVTTLKEMNSKRRLLHHILVQISDHSGFLIEDRLRELLAPHTVIDKIIIRLDNVFQALEIKTENEVDMMLDFFLPYAYCPTCTAEEENIQAVCGPLNETPASSLNSDDIAEVCGEDNEEMDDIREELLTGLMSPCKDKTVCGISLGGDDGSSLVPSRTEDRNAPEDTESEYSESEKKRVFCRKGHPFVIQTVYVMKGLREFVAKYHTVHRGEIPQTFKEKLSEQKLTISRNLTVEDISEFWRRYREIFSAKKEKLWDGLLIGLHKYHEILKERHKLNIETGRLRKQNSELRRLLEIYMLKPWNGLPQLEVGSESNSV